MLDKKNALKELVRPFVDVCGIRLAGVSCEAGFRQVPEDDNLKVLWRYNLNIFSICMLCIYSFNSINFT